MPTRSQPCPFPGSHLGYPGSVGLPIPWLAEKWAQRCADRGEILPQSTRKISERACGSFSLLLSLSRPSGLLAVLEDLPSAAWRGFLPPVVGMTARDFLPFF